ncbi:hypothetical protein B0T19DRAFT_432935 [Cercophora scortea]|uniref:NAD(P)-binding protein n=1 Tax=Cercophora scortea TaxID=314031 RepID=A0AAE0M5W5_9PEZI|nr:hypothetical protein B0T19DRAFT_432935 [Cercophora scortea]
MGNVVSQIFFIPPPTLTEKNCPDQTGRVFLVTGGYAGVGLELCKILYAHNATVWIAGRSAAKAEKAIASIKASATPAGGRIDFLQLDLADLSTIKPAIESFTAKETRLDVLVNNAGVMYPPKGTLDAQGNDIQFGTNLLGPYLVYRLLRPLLQQTAANSPTGTVRVAWAGSVAVHVRAPRPGGMVVDADGRPTDQGVMSNYGQTKVGNAFFARHFAKTTAENGVVHVAFNPGNLRTELQRHWRGVDAWVTDKFLLYPPIFGAYTELWSVLTPELTPAKSGAYVYPWGRFGDLPAGVEASMKGEPSVADKFVEWCERETRPFA